MYRAVLLLLLASGLFGQDAAFERLKTQATQLKNQTPDEKDPVAQIAPLHLALRDWIESHLPPDKPSIAGTFSNIEGGLQAQLKIAGLTGDAADDDDITFGYADVEFHQFPELPDTVFVTAAASIPCGFDRAVYGYQFGTTRTRILDYHPGGFGNPEMELSTPDAQGRRVLLIHSQSVQCQSTWMNLAYSAYRFAALPGVPQQLLFVKHGFWFGNDDGPEFYLQPDGLAVEYLDASVDGAVHNRTQVYRYLFGDSVGRADPVALQPQDFVEEWLTRPWEEMQSRSAPDVKDAHARLHGDYVWADYLHMAACSAQPGRWSIELAITSVGDTKLDPAARRFFLVHELGQNRYRMESVTDAAPQGCAIEGQPSDKHPWLAPSGIWNLPR
jgi:hypothetical protein